MRTTDGASYFADEVNPTADELRAWAWSGASAPWEDFHMVLDSEDVLPVVIQCAEDPGCPTRAFLLESLYCTVGHLPPSDRARVGAVAADAETSPDPAVRTWARRAVAVIIGIRPMDRAEWCGWPSLAITNPIES
jgi:hypothetical protein